MSAPIMGALITTPGQTAALIRESIQESGRAALWLDEDHRVIEVQTLDLPDDAPAQLRARECLRVGLQLNATACILASIVDTHDVCPSGPDMRLDSQVRLALATVDVRMLDHLKITPSDYFSFALALT